MNYALLGSVGPQSTWYKADNGNDICQLPSPIVFDTNVDDKNLIAFVTHAEDNATQWLYHVQFSDGHKAVFMANRKKKWIVEQGQKKPSAYAKAIEEDLLCFYMFNPFKPLPFYLPVMVKGEKVRVWAKRDEQGCFDVFVNGAYRFFVHYFNGRWQAETLGHPDSFVVPEVAEAVVAHLTKNIKITLVDPELAQGVLNKRAQA